MSQFNHLKGFKNLLIIFKVFLRYKKNVMRIQSVIIFIT